MKKKTIFIFVTVCVLSISFYIAISNALYYAKVKEVLEYEYDFTSWRALRLQVKNLGFEARGKASNPPEIKFGFSKSLSLIASAITTNANFDTRGIRIYFDKRPLFERLPLSENNKNSIRNFLHRQYGKPESVIVSKLSVPQVFSPVEKLHTPTMRWELEDRYLYLNDYPDIDVFEIRIKMK